MEVFCVVAIFTPIRDDSLTTAAVIFVTGGMTGGQPTDTPRFTKGDGSVMPIDFDGTGIDLSEPGGVFGVDCGPS